MLGNWWFKKEKPVQGLLGLGGGVGFSVSAGAGGGYEASGGAKTRYTTGGKYYFIHSITDTGNTSFVCSTAAESNYENVDVLLIAGGGGGGMGEVHDGGGGGGGGGGNNIFVESAWIN